MEKKGFRLGKRPRPPQQKSSAFGWQLKKFTLTVYVWVSSIMIRHFSVKIGLLSISLFHGGDWSCQSDPASLSLGQIKLLYEEVHLSEQDSGSVQALYTTAGLGPLPCLLFAVIAICRLSNGVRCLEYIFFRNARDGDMAAKGSFGRQKCFLCGEAYLISGFWAFLLFPSVHL